MDRLTEKQRRKNMQAVKANNTKIELILRKALWKNGYRYRKNYKNLIGKPDIVFVSHRVVIFCDGEFWHGFEWEKRKNDIKSNQSFWVKKIEGNIRRDMIVNETLQKEGWTVLRFWGKDIIKNLNYCIEQIKKALDGKMENYD